MSPQDSSARLEALGTPRDLAAAWALPARPADGGVRGPGRSANDDALLALLKEDDEAPAIPGRLAPRRLLRGMLLRWRLVALIVACALVAGATTALAVVERQWQGAVTLIVSDRDAVLSVGGGQPYQTRDYGLETLIDTLKLPSSLDEALRRSGVEASRLQLAAAVDVRLAQKSDVVNLKVNWTSPEEAATLANHLADVFVERTTRIRRDQAAQDHDNYARQLADARRRLAAVDMEVLAFQQQNRVANFEEETKARLIDLSRLQAEHWASEGEVEALRIARADFETALASVPETVTSTLFRNPLGKRMEEVEWQLKEARTRYTEENPKVVKLREQHEALRRLSAGSEFTGGETTRSPNDLRRDLKVKLQELVTTLRVAEGRESGLASSIAHMESKIGELSALEKQFRQLEARQAAARELERSLSGKLEEARVAMTAGQPSLQIVERAMVPVMPEPSARKAVAAACAIAGILLALGLALWLEIADRRVRCSEDLDDLVDEGGACAEVATWSPAASDGVNLASPAFRSFRRFVNTLCATDAAWTSLAVVSPSCGDGRSTVARAMALCLATRGDKTLLVDGDLRAASGPRSVAPSGPGLIEAVTGAAGIDECLRRGEHGRLAVMPCSRQLITEESVLMLSEPEAHRTLSAVASRGRRLILDLPPAGEDEGAFEIACHADAVVVVTRHGSTGRSALAHLVERLRARGVRIAGAVVLDVPPERLHPYAGPSVPVLLRTELQRMTRLFRRSERHA